MPKFSPQNFPLEHNEDFNGAGERTCHAAKESSFLLLQDSPLIGKSVILPRGTPIYFTRPERLFRGPQINTKHGIYASISLVSKDAQGDGYVLISHVEKPAGNSGRVLNGKKTQEQVRDYFSFVLNERGLEHETVSIAPPGSQAPDLVMCVSGIQQQFEIKGQASSYAPITLFDKSARRESYPQLLDDLTGILLQEKVSFSALIDYYKEEVCESYGFAEDETTKKSGKLPDVLKSSDNDVCAEFREYIIDHFAEGGDNYFVVHNRSDESFSYYHTEHGENLLDADVFPILLRVELGTYGGPANGATRVGVKIKLC